MSDYPNSNQTNENKYTMEFEKTNNSRYIKNSLNTIKNQAKNLIQTALNKKVKEIRNEMAKVPAIYTNVKNNLTKSNEAEKKKMEETIANTGNHTASGYAMSKRLHNLNELNKEINSASLAEENAIADYKNEIDNAIYDAEMKKTEIDHEYKLKALQGVLSENEKEDEYNFNVSKLNMEGLKAADELNEKIRVNDANIKNKESELELKNNEDLRNQELHEIEKKYLPEKYQAEMDYTYEKIKNEKANTENLNLRNYDTTVEKSKSSSSANGSKSAINSSSQKTNNNTTSTQTTKVSSKELATSIEKLAGVKKYDNTGKSYYEIDANTAYTYLMSWKKKYNLSNQVVNDIAIYLGIQDFL